MDAEWHHSLESALKCVLTYKYLLSCVNGRFDESFLSILFIDNNHFTDYKLACIFINVTKMSETIFKIGDIKMSKITKVMIAVSAAVLITISTNSHSYTEGEGIGGGVRAVEQTKHEANSMSGSRQSKVDKVRKSTNSNCYAKGEGIGGRAWTVEQAKCRVN